MKKFILTVAMAFAATALFGQVISPNASYKELKNIYSTSNYQKSDIAPYSPFWVGLSSLGAPGVGQFLCRESGRGWAFLGGNVAIGIVESASINKVASYLKIDDDGNYSFTDEAAVKKHAIVFFSAILADAVLSIWSCADAVKVAKVKNMYYQDLAKRRAVNADLHPSVNLVQTANGYTPAPGMTFAVSF